MLHQGPDPVRVWHHRSTPNRTKTAAVHFHSAAATANSQKTGERAEGKVTPVTTAPTEANIQKTKASAEGKVAAAATTPTEVNIHKTQQNAKGKIIIRPFSLVLPTDLLGSVLCFLARGDVLSSARVCKVWRGVSEQDCVWRTLYLSRWSPEASLSPRVCIFGPNTCWKDRMQTSLRFESNWKAGRHKRTLVDAHTEPIVRLASDYFVIVSATQREIKVWDTTQSLLCIFSLWVPDIPANITSLLVQNGLIAYGMMNGAVAVWDYAKKMCVRQYRHHSGPVTCMVFDAIACRNTDDDTEPVSIFSGSTDGTAIFTVLRGDESTVDHGDMKPLCVFFAFCLFVFFSLSAQSLASQ